MKKSAAKTRKTSRLGHSPLGEKTAEKTTQKPVEEQRAESPTLPAKSTQTISVPPEHYHEKLLRLHAAAALDLVESVGRYREMLDLQAQVFARDLARTRKICSVGLPRGVEPQVIEFLRDDLTTQVLRRARAHLAEAFEVLSDQMGFFARVYNAASRELGGPKTGEILAEVHRSYLNGPEAFVPTWKIFLELVKREGIELRFPH